MENLVEYTEKNTAYYRKKLSFKIRFNSDGRIRITYAVCDLIDVKSGDRISLLQDSIDKKKWYIKKNNIDGFKVVDDKKGCLYFGSSHVSDLFFQSIGICRIQPGITCIVGRDVVIDGANKMVQIISNSAKVKASNNGKEFSFTY